ncbi:MAG: hypothetical protein JXB05_07795 [Myxococcaceae bacterium]|nr:hypothetical protein [Myxococcaceae bacterium]
MSHRILLSCLLAVMAGCTRSARPDSESETPRYEHVFLKPLEEALAETQKLLAEKGYTFVPTEDETLLLTRWQKTNGAQWGNESEYRYLVSGLRLGSKQSVVRIFRMWRTEISNNSEQRPNLYKFMQYHHTIFEAQERNPIEEVNKDRGGMHGLRDLPLEKELALRLESGAGIEVVARNIAPGADRPHLRGPDFYLARWKQDVSGPATEVQPCPQEVRELNTLLKPRLTMLIGEQLGSSETPRVVGDAACQSAAAGLAVTLGLSIPRTEQERINRYLASPGAPGDQDELLRGPFWRRPYQDGRSSRAIMDLIDRIRSLRTYGLFISVVAYDTDEATGTARDALLSEVWEKRRKERPEELFIILAGNTHARTVEGTSWDRDFVPMARRLASNDPGMRIFDLSYAQGRRWGCDLNRQAKLVCTVVGASPSERVAAAPGQTPYVKLFAQPTEEGHHGLLYVGALTPSMPAISLEGHEPPPESKAPQPPKRTRD